MTDLFILSFLFLSSMTISYVINRYPKIGWLFVIVVQNRLAYAAGIMRSVIRCVRAMSTQRRELWSWSPSSGWRHWCFCLRSWSFRDLNRCSCCSQTKSRQYESLRYELWRWAKRITCSITRKAKSGFKMATDLMPDGRLCYEFFRSSSECKSKRINQSRSAFAKVVVKESDTFLLNTIDFGSRATELLRTGIDTRIDRDSCAQ